MTDPVRFYAEDDFRIPKLLSHAIQERIDGLSSEILNGQLDTERYKFFTGTVQGLRICLDELKRISEELS